MREIIRKISEQTQINNIEDAVVTGVNLDGTYNLQLLSGVVKQNAIDISNGMFVVGDVVNISLVRGSRETAKILGKSKRKTRTRRTFFV